MVPENTDDLLVAEKSISVSHLVNGASRLQPAVMLIGQAAGAAAALCIQEQLEPRELPFKKVQTALLESNCWLLPYLDTDPSDPYFQAIQRLGTTGIMRGKGVPFKWANQTWFYPDSLSIQEESYSQILERTTQYLELSLIPLPAGTEPISYGQALSDLAKLLGNEGEKIDPSTALSYLESKSGEDLLPTPKALDAPLTRKELAYILDQLIKPFEN